jgi:hypothetical protein
MPSSSTIIPPGPFILEETPWGGAPCLFGSHQVAITLSRSPPYPLEIQTSRKFLQTRCSPSLGARPYATRYLALRYLISLQNSNCPISVQPVMRDPIGINSHLVRLSLRKTHSPAQSTPPIDFTNATVKRPSGLNGYDTHGSFVR